MLAANVLSETLVRRPILHNEYKRLGVGLLAAASFTILSVCPAQDVTVRSTSRLVVAPMVATERSGEFLEGLKAGDVVVYDNNVPIEAHLEEFTQPLSLVVVVQATTSAQPMLEKLRKEISLLGPLILGESGEGAVIAFADEVRVIQDFTRDSDKIERVVRNLDAFGGRGLLVDALKAALDKLAQRPIQRRRAILVVSEKHDRGSQASLRSLVALAEQVNPTVYGITFSPSQSVFTNRAAKYCDRKCRRCTCGNCGNHCDREQPQDVPTIQSGGFNPFALLGELKRQTQPDVPGALAKLTGGETWSFLKKQGLAASIERVGADLHRGYVLTFPMSRSVPGSYHSLRVAIPNRPEAVIRTRSGYYEVFDQ